MIGLLVFELAEVSYDFVLVSVVPPIYLHVSHGLGKSPANSSRLELIALDFAVSTRVGQLVIVDAYAFALAFETVTPAGAVLTASGTLLRI